MKYSVKEIIEMKKAGIHDDIIVAINKFGWKVDNSDVIELQNNFDDTNVIEMLKDMNGVSEAPIFSGKKVGTGAGAYSTDLKDYEPKKQDGNYNWTSYKAKCKAYCYAVATNGVANSYKKDIGIDFEEGSNFKKAYDKAKADFKATFKYIKKADR